MSISHSLPVLSRECGNEPRRPLKTNHQLDGLSRGQTPFLIPCISRTKLECPRPRHGRGPGAGRGGGGALCSAGAVGGGETRGRGDGTGEAQSAGWAGSPGGSGHFEALFDRMFKQSAWRAPGFQTNLKLLQCLAHA